MKEVKDDDCGPLWETKQQIYKVRRSRRITAICAGNEVQYAEFLQDG